MENKLRLKAIEQKWSGSALINSVNIDKKIFQQLFNQEATMMDWNRELDSHLYLRQSVPHLRQICEGFRDANKKSMFLCLYIGFELADGGISSLMPSALSGKQSLQLRM